MTRENETYSAIHSYGIEGKYNASIYVANSLNGKEDWVAHLITFKIIPLYLIYPYYANKNIFYLCGNS